MKVSKDYLKQVVKECLIEILNEGLAGNRQQASRQPIQRQQFSGIAETATRQQPLARRLSPLDQPANVRHNQSNNNQINAMKEAVRQSSGGNSILAGILEDTAATTFQSMIKNDQPGHAPVAGDVYARTVAENSLEDMFGNDVTSKWAALAFDEPESKKMT